MYAEDMREHCRSLETGAQNLVERLQQLSRPQTMKQPLPEPDVTGLRALVDQLQRHDYDDSSMESLEELADIATELGDHLFIESRRQTRSLRRFGREIHDSVDDPAVCGPQFGDIEKERKAREQIATDLEDASRHFEGLASKIEKRVAEIKTKPVKEIPKKGPLRDPYLEKAKKEVDRAAGDKELALQIDSEYKESKRENKEGKLELPPGYENPTRKALEDAKNIAVVGMAESHISLADSNVSIASSLRDMSQNPMGTSDRPVRVQMKRAEVADTPDKPLWLYLRSASEAVGWERYQQFMEDVLCADAPGPDPPNRARVWDLTARRLRLPFPDTDAYRFLKVTTEVFLMTHCGVFAQNDWSGPTEDERLYAGRRFGSAPSSADILRQWTAFTTPTSGAPRMLPYLALIREKLGDVGIVEWSRGEHFARALAACSGLLRERLAHPCLLELIWSYWHEEGMLVQTMNAISRRFQNIRTPGDRDPLAAFELDPLRPLNNFLWGYIQDEQHRLTVVRRAYEYDHHYGLALVGKAVHGMSGADSRKRFIDAFHNLLHVCTTFYKEDDDTTVIADGFSVLNALREVHIILSQGAHNQYGDLPWTARQEMLMQQWLLARQEMREFLPARIMVAYPEPWMDRVDAMKTLMGWTDTSVLHFRELGIYGERILLGARFNVWTSVIEPERAANWARFWRPEIQGYVHAYRAATGSDLAERTDGAMPSTLLRNRLAAQRVAPR